jgi:hypothetical protein
MEWSEMRLSTALDPTINFTLRERANRIGEMALIWVAHALPYRLKYRVYIDFAVTHLRDDDIVPEVGMTEILRRAK